MATSKKTPTLLSEQERELLKLLSEGYSYREISDQLMIPLRSIYDLFDGVMRRLAIRDKAGMVKFAGSTSC